MPRKPKRTEGQEARRFAVILALLLGALAGFAGWRHHALRAELLGGTAVLVLLVAFAVPRAWLAFFRLWMKGAMVLGAVMTRVLLTLFFFVVLTPYGLVMRLLGRAPLDVRFGDGRASYWIDKPPQAADAASYERQF